MAVRFGEALSSYDRGLAVADGGPLWGINAHSSDGTRLDAVDHLLHLSEVALGHVDKLLAVAFGGDFVGRVQAEPQQLVHDRLDRLAGAEVAGGANLNSLHK